jgi:hypothetical protein
MKTNALHNTSHVFASLPNSVVAEPEVLTPPVSNLSIEHDPDLVYETQTQVVESKGLTLLIKNINLYLCFFNWAPHHEGVLGELKYRPTHYLTSALDRGEWLASRPGRFTPRERDPGTHWIGGWVGLRAVLDAVVKRKITSPCRESNLRSFSP